MSDRSILAVLAVAIAATGCASGPPFIDAMQPEAVSIATKRAQFEMNCPEAKGEVLSRETIEPQIRAPRYGGVERAEYTVGVSGCGKRSTLVVICPDNGQGSSCFAGGGRGEAR